MVPTPVSAEQPLLHALLLYVLRAETIALEGLCLQAQAHSGLLGGNVAQLVQAAEERAYQRAEAMLAHLLAADGRRPTPPATA